MLFCIPGSLPAEPTVYKVTLVEAGMLYVLQLRFLNTRVFGRNVAGNTGIVPLSRLKGGGDAAFPTTILEYSRFNEDNVVCCAGF
jgi:hypothetical protein